MVSSHGYKIALIGAGSAAWAIGLVKDLALIPSLSGSTVVLMDIDEGRLALVSRFAKRYVSEVKGNLNIVTTTDRREAIKDADFVVNSTLAKGHGHYERMREISEKYGYYRGINSVEWNMVSDYHTIWGYYQFKLALDIANDVVDYAPNAWLLNVSNPVFELTTLISRETKAKVIGLCDGYYAYKDLLRVLGLDEGKAEVEVIGVNHDDWLTRLKYNGEDAYHLIDEWINVKSSQYFEKWREEQSNPFDVHVSPAAVDMYRAYGLWPIGDTVRSGTWKYHWDLKTKQYWYGPLGGPDSEIGWAMYLTWHKIEFNELKRALENEAKPLTEHIPPVRSEGEPVTMVIEAMIEDKAKTIEVNVPNQGAIPGIQDDVAVEMPAVIDAKGVHRLSFSNLPKAWGRVLKYTIMPRVIRGEWAIEAFLGGGRDALFNWLIIDPRTKSNEQVNQVIDAILKIPGNEEMAKHFS
ncbi:MAG: alpha-glucosidase/alpha-galactosidase [Caldivirga sp.]|uniref:family 4 glycosyl hydrolase n=1 Tax=Caldivirga sp. TaxID=2080243 RepID=UPI003D0EED92